MNADNIFEIIIILLLILIILCIVIRVRRLSHINEVSEHFDGIIEYLSTEDIAIAGEIKNNTNEINQLKAKLDKMTNKIDSSSTNTLLQTQRNKDTALSTTLTQYGNQIQEQNNQIMNLKSNVDKMRKNVNDNTIFIDTLSEEINKFEEEVQNIEEKEKKKKK